MTNTRKIGKNFERKAERFLKTKFKKVEWLSKNHPSTFDFKCIDNKGNKYNVEAKKNEYPRLNKRQKDADFVVTNKKNEIILIPKKYFKKNKVYIDNSDGFSIMIDKDFKDWLSKRGKKGETYQEIIKKLIERNEK